MNFLLNFLIILTILGCIITSVVSMLFGLYEIRMKELKITITAIILSLIMLAIAIALTIALCS